MHTNRWCVLEKFDDNAVRPIKKNVVARVYRHFVGSLKEPAEEDDAVPIDL